MINGFPYIDRVRSDEEMKELVRVAVEDNHSVFCPTHPVKKEKRFVGYFSVASPRIPIVLAWLSTKELSSRDSCYLVNTLENSLAMQGAVGVCFAVNKDSPFHKVMENAGYKNGGSYDLFIKEF